MRTITVGSIVNHVCSVAMCDVEFSTAAYNIFNCDHFLHHSLHSSQSQTRKTEPSLCRRLELARKGARHFDFHSIFVEHCSVNRRDCN